MRRIIRKYLGTMLPFSELKVNYLKGTRYMIQVGNLRHEILSLRMTALTYMIEGIKSWKTVNIYATDKPSVLVFPHDSPIWAVKFMCGLCGVPGVVEVNQG